MLSNRYGTKMMLQQVENCLKLDLGGSILLRLVLNMATMATFRTWMVVKKERFEEAQAVFDGTGVNVTQEGKRYLGVSLGTKAFTGNFVSEKVLKWTKEIEVLSTFAVSQPHAAYACYTHGLSSKLMDLSL